MEQVIIIGAGPCGLAAALALKKAGIDPLIIDKGPTVQAIYNYPTYMVFHSTAELLEIGGYPFITPNDKPTRLEALLYYRTVAERNELRIQNYENVTALVKRDIGGFHLTTENRFGEQTAYEAANVVVATGYFDHPNRLGVPGEQLSKVMSYYKESHPYAGMKVAIVGGNNSAIDSSLDLQRAGADVTVIYRGATISSKVKAWTAPLFESAVAKGKIKFYTESHVLAIEPHTIRINTPDGEKLLDNDFVFSLIGYRPDRSLLQSVGVQFTEERGVPQFDVETMETNVPGLYLAGVIAAGNEANAIFIETGRFHGEPIAKSIAASIK